MAKFTSVKEKLEEAIVNSLAASFWVPSRMRLYLLRSQGLRIRDFATVAPRVIIRGHGLSLGEYSTINYDCVLDARAEINIGHHSGIGIKVQIITASHDYSNPSKRAGNESFKPIVIGNGVWVGSGATILQGLTLGDGCVVAAGSVVTTDCDPHCLYAGVPARLIRRLPD